MSTILGTSLTYHLHAVNLGGAGGEYTYDGTDSDNAVTTGKPLDDITLNFTSGNYTTIGIFSPGTGSNTVGTAADPINITINILGNTSANFNVTSTTLNNLWGFTGQNGSTSIYATTTLNINSSGTMSGVVFTSRANYATTTYEGNIIANITSGTITAAAGADATLSLAAGDKSSRITGDVIYTLGALESGGPTVQSNIYGGTVGSGGTIDGNINITLNSGTYTNVYGAGSTGTSVSGDVTINYNGGELGGGIFGTAGGTVGGTSTLNIGGGAKINSSKIVFSTFDVVSLAGTLELASGDPPAAPLNININGGLITANKFTLSGAGSLTSTGSAFADHNIQNATLTNLHLTVNDGQSLTLTNTTLSNSAISTSISGNASTTAIPIDSLDAVEYIFAISNIEFSTVSIDGSLTLNISLTGDALSDYNAYLAANTGYAGFELDGIALGDLQDSYSDVIINLIDGESGKTLFYNTARGVVAGSDGNAVLYIPEPSTATLSLLALTGLLARRRRQAA